MRNRLIYASSGGPSVTTSIAAHTGPAMPVDRVALYASMIYHAGSHTVSTVDEEGNIARIDPDPALFEVPPGFVKKNPLVAPWH